ncbi:tetratricopeptide repeat protein [Caulobacter sp. S45]|uniref:tetratricopeptide repeat protein n=1 Tax=Caulobacter sp. S45 TaxID=1641861 RepID=UPI0015773538|nr:tetratricopeptide repeat protein [Caulobacter sp. S45]
MAHAQASPGSDARPLPARTLDATAGADPLEKLTRALAELKAQAILPLLSAATQALNAGHIEEALHLTSQVLEAAPDSGLAWRLVALCRERGGDLNGALNAYEAALQLDPKDADLANDLGRLAMQMGLFDVAEQLFRHFMAERPDAVDGPNNLACALRDQLRYGDALDVLRPTILAKPESALLWNTLGATVAEQGETDQSVIFFDEALRLDPGFAKARYNRANVRLSLGDPAGALEDCETALQSDALSESERAMMNFARSTMLVASGRLGEGWDAYQVRLQPRHVDVTHFAVDDATWTPDASLEGASLLVFGEQGLGDEVLFANLIPDLLKALGPEGRLTLAVERRLVPLFSRSFPTAEVGAHATYRVEHQSVRTAPFARDRSFDLWAPVASLLQRFRRGMNDFPHRPAYLHANPVQVDYWRQALAELGAGMKVGLLWKSLKVSSQRSRFYSPFAAWAPVLATPGVRFVNLQYGDCAEEIAHAREVLGIDIWTPPGPDLKEDLDEVAALASALDLVVGPANATINLAAACGASSWFVCPPGGWPMLGTHRYPWYPKARVFSPPGFNRWEPVMTELAEALRQDASPMS